MSYYPVSLIKDVQMTASALQTQDPTMMLHNLGVNWRWRRFHNEHGVYFILASVDEKDIEHLLNNGHHLTFVTTSDVYSDNKITMAVHID